MDETYIKIKGQWYYLYRAVDKHGQTIDFLLTTQRDERAAKRFLTKAIGRHGVPEKITIDGSAANEAAIKQTPFGRTIALARRTPWSHRDILGSQSEACRPDTHHETWPCQPPQQ
jgi:transposase-like protein